jgi:hypothetical protein
LRCAKTNEAMSESEFLEGDAFLAALRDAGIVPDSTREVSVWAQEGKDMRIFYKHLDEDPGGSSEPVLTTSKLFRGTAAMVGKILAGLTNGAAATTDD